MERQVVVIREAECIGCTKCIDACPVDAILGAGKQMHTVIASECIGCQLCIAPCPVDCIDLVQFIAEEDPTIRKGRTVLAKERYQFRQKRLSQKKREVTVQNKKAYIEAAIQRGMSKKT